MSLVLLFHYLLLNKFHVLSNDSATQMLSYIHHKKMDAHHYECVGVPADESAE